MAPFHWQSNVNVQNVGVEDMILLRSLNDDAIVDNLKKRLAAKAIFTYIGPVLISVNPFQEMPYFTEKEMEQYQGATQYENPPHIYALADNMYRNMMIDAESQCVIISGESGAGKTVAAKYIMGYVARISGGGQRVQHVKDVIIKSNPLLEAFGNAATLRNWNSSRFGKYVEIQFGLGGEPLGGRVTSFLLEKSRVVRTGAGERNFHVFHQLLAGADAATRQQLGLRAAADFAYVAAGADADAAAAHADPADLQQTLAAMRVVGVEAARQRDILQLVAAVLHIGNLGFVEAANYARVADDHDLQFPAYLLGISPEAVKEKLTTRKLESRWGNKTEKIDVSLNVEQAVYTRDAWAKGLYSRLFDYLVNTVNNAMRVPDGRDRNLSIGILDIYGFEIFDHNGFEQFCINYVNEKLQQIFIELTLKAEQEEYVSEGIQWTPVDFFNNKIVCDLIESKNPPGLMCHLDDICAQIHGQSDGCDQKFLVKMSQNARQNPHFKSGSDVFIITHYAGDVKYNVDGFCDKNRDVMYQDLIEMMQGSESEFVRALFPENVRAGAKAKPASAASQIRAQANQLVGSLRACTPHYVRCIKPNERKRALDFDAARVRHQVRYLGLQENVRVRRAGFAYRRAFDKFLWRYAILTSQTWPRFDGDVRQGCALVCRRMGLAADQFQLGRTKLFIKNPESLFMLEEARERKYDGFARVLQKAFRRFTAAKRHARQKEEASRLVLGHKQRRRHSLNRNFVGDYVGLAGRPGLRALLARRERVDFAHALWKRDRRFRAAKLEALVTARGLWLVGRDTPRNGPNAGKPVEALKRHIPWAALKEVGLSTLQDDYLFIQVHDEYTSVLESPLKTEMLTVMNKHYLEQCQRPLPLNFANSHVCALKKLKYNIMGQPGVREYKFVEEPSSSRVRTDIKGKLCTVFVPTGLPANTKPANRQVVVPKCSWASRQSAARMADQRAPPAQAHAQKPPHDFRRAHDEPPKAEAASRLNGSSRVHPLAEQQNISPAPPRPVPKPKPTVKPRGPTVRAIYAYDAQDTDELSFQESQIIELIRKVMRSFADLDFPKVDEFEFGLLLALGRAADEPAEPATPASPTPSSTTTSATTPAHQVERAPCDQVLLKLEAVSGSSGVRLMCRWDNFNVPASVSFFAHVEVWILNADSDKKHCATEKSKILNETARFSVDLPGSERLLAAKAGGCVCVSGRVTVKQALRDAHLKLAAVERNQPRLLCAQLAKFLRNQNLTDCEIRTDSDVFKAHKLVLAANSEVFERMFAGDFRESRSCTVHMPDVRSAVVAGMLAFLYTGTVPQFEDVGRELLFLADKYHIQTLLDFCSIRLMGLMSCDLACELLVGPPSIMHLDALKTEIIEFLIDHYNEFVRTDAWRGLAQSGNEALLTELFRGFADHVHRAPAL